MTEPISLQSTYAYGYIKNYKVNSVNPVLSNSRYYSANNEQADNISKKFDRVEISEKAKEYLKQTECETCEARKYRDISNDAGVSFKSPTNISPQQSFSAVVSHENEHVVRNAAKAERENKEVVSQSVRLKTEICPECHKAYIAGGVTTTVTKSNGSENIQGNYYGVGKRLNCLV